MVKITQIRDQALHTIFGALIVYMALQGNAFGAALAGLACGLIREVAESGTPVTWIRVKKQLIETDARYDLVFWAIGGLIAGLIA